MHLKNVAMSMIFLASMFWITSVLGGTRCPPRWRIYPCSCFQVQHTKNRFTTIVSCHRLENTDSLNAIYPFLRSMEIDQFYLYDSFWPAHLLGADGESQKVLPMDFISLMKVKEIEIVDTTLSPCFACGWQLTCSNSDTLSIRMTNSSTTDKICTLCDTSRGNKYPWTACLSQLEEFGFNFGKLTSIGADFFPLAMRQLKHLNFSYNRIDDINTNAFKNMPQLTTLDLSHNALEYLGEVNFSQARQLQYIDISWNFIKGIGDDFLASLPNLNTFKAAHNDIFLLKESEWNKISKKLRFIDISNNKLRCECSAQWINGTFSSRVVLLGTCHSPSEYQDTTLRRASRFLMERCDAAGNMGTRKPTTPKPKRPRGRQ